MAGAVAGPAERRLGAVLAALLPLIAIVWILDLPRRLGWFVFNEQAMAAMLGIGLAVVFLHVRADGGRDRAAGWPDRLLALAGLALGAHLALRFPVLSEGAFLRPVESLAVGTVMLALVLTGLVRIVGWALVIVLALFVLYALFGDLAPGRLQGRPVPLAELVSFLGTDSATVLGPTLQVACFVVLVYILLGAVLVTVGGTDVLNGLAAAMAGRGRGGAAKISVASSALFGTISGSAVSNVMSSGIVTIPLMRRSGMAPHRAAAVEATASTGGQIMPPVMGAAAFLMAENLRVPYSDIVLAATLPALLFFAAVFVQLDLTARRERMAALGAGESLPGARIGREGAILGIAFALLLGTMFGLRWSAQSAALAAIAALVVLGAVGGSAERRMTPARLWDALVQAGRGVGEVLLICAVAGMIVGILGRTGLGFSLSLLLLQLGQGAPFLLLLVTALVSLVLGMGMPTTAVYLLLAILVAPSLIQLGLEPMAAHMFVFYFGILSMITPPVAIAAFAAASLAGAAPMRTAFACVRYGWVAFLVPFLFVYQPAILMRGQPLEILAGFAVCLLGIVLVTAGAVGHGLRPLAPAARLLALGLGVGAILPPDAFPYALQVEIGAALGGLAALAWHASAARREPVTA